MATLKIKDKYLEYSNKKYFRSNSPEIELGCWGEKKSPAFGTNYLSVSGKIATRHLDDRPIKMSGPFDINWSSVSKAEFEAEGKVKVFGINVSGTNSFNYSDAKEADIKLVYFYINESPLTRCLNNDANIVREAMADEGRDARVVSGVWVAMEGDLAAEFDANFNSSHTVEKDGNSLEITVSTSRSHSYSITLAPGSCFAYKMHKVKKWSRGKEKIEDMEDDYYSMG